jgi:hypothetical protein
MNARAGRRPLPELARCTQRIQTRLRAAARVKSIPR